MGSSERNGTYVGEVRALAGGRIELSVPRGINESGEQKPPLKIVGRRGAFSREVTSALSRNENILVNGNGDAPTGAK